MSESTKIYFYGVGLVCMYTGSPNIMVVRFFSVTFKLGTHACNGSADIAYELNSNLNLFWCEKNKEKAFKSI